MKNIIFYHIEQGLWKESQGYLEINLKCAVKFNPDSKIYLLGDKDPQVEGVRFIDCRNLGDERIEVFKRIYIHLSPNPPLFEINSILRYFYIYNFCQTYNLTTFLTPDTDVMILTDLSKIDFDCKFATHIDYGSKDKFKIDSYMICNHFLWCYDIHFLDGFIEIVMNQYRLKNEAYIYTIYKKMKDKSEVAGISDMVLWGLFCYYNELRFHNLRGYKPDKPFFEESVSTSEGFEMENGLKRIVKLNDKLYFIRKNDDLVPINIIHWNGANKKYIKDFYERYLGGRLLGGEV